MKAKTLVETTCENCGKTFLVEPSKLKNNRGKTCSLECSYRVRKQGNMTRFLTNCERCGKQFYSAPSRKAKGHGRYCSRECAFPPQIATCLHCGKEFRYSPSGKRRFCSAKCANLSDSKSENSSRNVTLAWSDPGKRERIMAGIKRRSDSPEWRSAAHFQPGEKHPRYKGNRKARKDAGRYQYKKWHRDVLEACNFTCQKCGKRGGRLEAHHIEPWAQNESLRFDVSNGTALCEDCHLATHNRKSKPITKICECCGNEFRPAKRAQKFCNRQCFYQSMRKIS